MHPDVKHAGDIAGKWAVHGLDATHTRESTSANLRDYHNLHLVAKAPMAKLPVYWDGCDHVRQVGFASFQEV